MNRILSRVFQALSQRNFLFAFIALCALFCVLALSAQYGMVDAGRTDSVPPPIASGETELREYWKDQIQQHPAAAVYSSFIETYTSQDENKWHGAMHVLASLLYERYGIDALQFCDESFQQACFHELMSTFAYEGEITEESEINAHCGGNWNCLHGIGHGLVMYYGYDQENLTGVLSRCPSEPEAMPIAACQSGVFMEYITRTMGGSRGEIKKIAGQVDQGLCSEMEPEYRGPCNFVMVELIIAETGSSNEEIADSVGEYCRSSASGYEAECFTGAGFNVKFLTEEYDEGIALCESIAGDYQDHKDTCLIALAMQYMFFSKTQDSAMICEAASAEGKEECLSML